MKVAFLIPTYNKAEILQRTLGFIDRLKPQPDKYVFLENNSQDSTVQVLHEWRKNHSAEIIRLWFRDDAVKVVGDPFEIIGFIRQTLLDRARKLGVDYAIFVDDDIFIMNADFITRITSWKKDLVAASYSFPNTYRHGIFLNAVWSNQGEDKQTHPYLWKKTCSGLQEVLGVGTGATCISQKLLMDRQVNFLPPITNLSEDFTYCVKAREHGYKVYLDCSLRLGHCFKATSYGTRLRYWHFRAWSRKSMEKTSGFVDFEYGQKLQGEKQADRFIVFIPPDTKMK